MTASIQVDIVQAHNEEDIRQIASLYPAKTADEQEEMVQRSLLPELAEQEQGRRTILLVRWKDRVIGTVQLVWDSDDDPVLQASDTAIIHHLRTHPDFRGRGVGKQLVDIAKQLVLSRGMARLTLGVEPGNHRARRFYESLGFEQFGQYQGEQGEHILAMEHRLGLSHS